MKENIDHLVDQIREIYFRLEEMRKIYDPEISISNYNTDFFTWWKTKRSQFKMIGRALEEESFITYARKQKDSSQKVERLAERIKLHSEALSAWEEYQKTKPVLRAKTVMIFGSFTLYAFEIIPKLQKFSLVVLFSK